MGGRSRHPVFWQVQSTRPRRFIAPPTKDEIDHIWPT
jgi:hypothetical protein